MFKALSARSFAFLWSGQTISRLGDQIYGLAMAWWILEQTGSAVAMSMVFVCSFLPTILFSLIGGVAVDRYSRLRVMLGSDLGRGLIVAVVAALAAFQWLEVWHIYVARVLFGIVDAFFQPAYAAAVPEITPQQVLPSANALTELSEQATGVVGPALAAAVIFLGGTSTALAFDALTFFISAACLLMVRSPALPRGASVPQSSPSIIRDAREGIVTVLRTPWLWILIVLSALLNVTINGPVGVALPFLIKDSFHADVSTLGLLSTMLSLGAVIGGVWMGRLETIRRRGLVVCGTFMAAGVMLLTLGYLSSAIVAALPVLILGVSLTMNGLAWTNLLQERIPQELLGRVASIDYIGSAALLPAGLGLAGWATEYAGASTVFALGGAVTVGLVILGLSHPAVQRLD
jgi:DHA3 family tetracycline resistance protein-like MFS transporter